MDVNISVIIPTYNDWDRLKLCLQSLSAQSIEKDSFEIIVVNNNPQDNVPKDYEISGNCKIITESKPGSYAARNKGIAMAKGDILAFTDSDCITDKDWLLNALKVFYNNSKISRIAGHIELFYQSDKLSPAELFESVYAFRQKKNAKEGVSVTGNFFVRKELFDVVGFFNEDLLSGGDFDWNRRAESLGYKIVYQEDVIIKHPARKSIPELIKKEKRVAGWIENRKGKALVRAVKYVIPPVNSLFHGNSLKTSERLIIFSIRYWLNILRTKEEILISFGKKSNRE